MKKGFVLASLLATACSMPTHVKVPVAIQEAPDEVPTMVARARGVQVYECRAKAGGAPEWAFVAPDAELFDVRGHPIGTHGAGPVWVAADGSTVRGSVKSRADAPMAGAIPWLLLTAKPEGAQGVLTKVTSIQRINTTGGVAPVGGCDAHTVGAPARVAYTADYVFFSSNPR